MHKNNRAKTGGDFLDLLKPFTRKLSLINLNRQVF